MVRSVERKETTILQRIKHGIPGVVHAGVVTLLGFWAVASLAAVVCFLLTPKGVKVHIHGGPWPVAQVLMKTKRG